MTTDKKDTDAQLIQKLRTHLLDVNDDNVRMRLQIQQLERENARLRAKLGDRAMISYTTPPKGLQRVRPPSAPRLKTRPPSESLASWSTPQRTDSIEALGNVEMRCVPSEAEEVSLSEPSEALGGRPK